MHNTDFIVDLDTTNDTQVASPRTLDIGIEDGVQAFPKPGTNESANRLMIFTGTAICSIAADGDGERSLGVVRIRLNFPISNTLHFVGSATVAALASVHGDDPEEALFAVDAAQTIVGPSDGGTIPDKGLPANDLYVILDAATMGADTNLNRLAYQANVLLNDIEPDLKSILVRPSGTAIAFAPETTIPTGSQWDFQVNLTGPVIDATFLILLQSSNPSAAPVAAATQLNQGDTSGAFLGGTATNPSPHTTIDVTITAIGRRATRTAILHIQGPTT